MERLVTVYSRIQWAEEKADFLAKTGWKAQDITAWHDKATGEAHVYHKRVRVWAGNAENKWDARVKALREMTSK